MKVLVLNGSPKKGGASKYLSAVLKRMLFGCKCVTYSLRTPRHDEEIFQQMKDADAVLLSIPLYVDGIPAHVIRFLKGAERFCRENGCRFQLYVLSNSGFIEGRQNEACLAQVRCWCGRAGVKWGGGLGIGGGVMLHVLFYVALILFGLFLAELAINLFSGRAAVSVSMAQALGWDALWLFALNAGMLFYGAMLARAIRRKREYGVRYTRVLLPSFLFLIVSDIFMALSALFHGKLIFSLYKTDAVDRK